MREKVRWENAMQEGVMEPRATCAAAAAGVLGEIEQLIVDQTVLRPESGHFPLFPLRPLQS